MIGVDKRRSEENKGALSILITVDPDGGSGKRERTVRSTYST